MDKGTTLKTDLMWARILVKRKGKVKPSSVNILVEARSYEFQIWWEIQPWEAEVYPLKSIASGRGDMRQFLRRKMSGSYPQPSACL